MLTHLRAIALAMLIPAAAWAAQPAADFYVSPAGNDAWSGKLAAPNGEKTDGPFATLARAQQSARVLRPTEPARKTPITVLIRGGVYTLSQAVEFTPADSGTTDSPTVYAAYADEQPIFSGGVRLTGFRKDATGRWALEIPEVRDGKRYFIQLFVNGQRRYRPRLPKQGYYNILDEIAPPSGARGYDRFRFKTGDIRPDWQNREDVDILAMQTWTMARLRIKDVDTASNTVIFTGTTHATTDWSKLKKGNRFLVENVKEALSDPGEWYLDRKTGVLTYIPKPGEDPATAEIIAPCLNTLLRVTGDIAQRKFVSNLVLRGLSFQYSNWVTPPEGNNYAQAEVNLSGAILLNGAHNCTIQNCRLSHVGVYGIDLAASCRENRIEGCEMTDLGAGGVKVGLVRVEPQDIATRGNLIRDNLIAHGGRLHPAAIGVWTGHSGYNTIEHNDIFDFYYTGVSVGWVWGYANSVAHHNTVAYNHIHHFGQGVLSDMGGIYTLGNAEGSVLHHNLIHDVDAFDYGGWGVYFDEGTTHILAENNIVYNTKTGGFHQHYGKENTVRNNIFAFTKRDQLQRTRAEPHLSFTFEHNIVYYRQGQLMGSNWTGDKFDLKNNIYWRIDGQKVVFPGKLDLAQWQAKGHDGGSLVVDPLFVDAQKFDFRLQSGSPAEKIGFAQIDISKAGRLTQRQEDLLDPPAFPTMESK